MTELVGLSALELFLDIFPSISETIIFYLLVSTFLKPRQSVSMIHKIIVVVSAFAIHEACYFLLQNTTLQLLISISVDLLIIWILFDDAWHKRILNLALFYLIVMVGEACVYTIFNNTFQQFSATDTINSYNLQGVTVVVVLRLAQYGCVVLARILKSKEIRRRQWMGLLLMPVISIGFAVFVYSRYWGVENEGVKTLLTIFGVFLVLQNLIVFLYMTIVQTSTERYLEMKDLQERERQYFATVSAVQRTVKKMRHDMRNHFIYVLNALEQEDVSKAKRYLIQLDNNLEQLTPTVITGNMDVDALLYVKAKQAAEHGILLEVEGILPQEMDVAPVDLNMLLGNALDNAIRAAAGVEVEEKTINILFMHKKRRLSFTVSNPYAGRVRRRPGGFFFSTRPGGGMGGEIMRDVVKKYDGYMATDTKDQLFTLTVFLRTDAYVEGQPLLANDG